MKKTLSFTSLIVLFSCVALEAATLDNTDSSVIVTALKHAGAQTTAGANQQNVFTAKQMLCTTSTPSQGNPFTECTFTDGADGQKLPIYTSADTVSNLLSQAGGTVSNSIQNGVAVQEVLAALVVCTSTGSGSDASWACAVN